MCWMTSSRPEGWFQEGDWKAEAETVELPDLDPFLRCLEDPATERIRRDASEARIHRRRPLLRRASSAKVAYRFTAARDDHA